MNKRDFYYGEVEIPENVQKKAELAFSKIKNEEVINMTEEKLKNEEMKKLGNYNKTEQNKRKYRKVIKYFVAAAACLSFVAAGIFFSNNGSCTDESNISAEQTNEYQSIQIDNPFVLTVHAEGMDRPATELREGVPVVINTATDNWVLGSSEDGSGYYCLNLPLSCEGENIDSITYQINKGAFQIVEKVGESIVINGKKLEKPLNTGVIGQAFDEETGMEVYPSEINYYTEFTVDYDCQSKETTWINMAGCDVVISDVDLIWGENRSKEDQRDGYQELIDGVVIRCTVHFTDGSTETVELEAGTTLATPRKLGILNAVAPDSEDVFFTFERK